jgi:hypothetical protein
VDEVVEDDEVEAEVPLEDEDDDKEIRYGQAGR